MSRFTGTHKQDWLFEWREETRSHIQKSPASLAKAAIHEENRRPRGKNTPGFTAAWPPRWGSAAILLSAASPAMILTMAVSCQKSKITASTSLQGDARKSDMKFTVKTLNLVFRPRKWKEGKISCWCITRNVSSVSFKQNYRTLFMSRPSPGTTPQKREIRSYGTYQVSRAWQQANSLLSHVGQAETESISPGYVQITTTGRELLTVFFFT